MRQVVAYYERLQCPFYSVKITNKMVELYHERYLRNEISYHYQNQMKHVASRMNEFYITGTLRIQANKHGTVYSISAEYENLIDRFIATNKYKQNTCDDVRWVVRRYLYYLEQKGHSTLEDVSIEEVRNFILETDCIELFSYKVCREMPIQSAVTDEELHRILAVIDRNTVTGKRDYAIIHTAASTGLRASDIIRLRLTDID